MKAKFVRREDWLAWHPSKKPPNPRVRIVNRRVRASGSEPTQEDFRHLDEALSSVRALSNQLPQHLSNRRTERLAQSFLRGAVHQYFLGRATSEPSRPELRYQLRTLAHWAWKVGEGNGDNRESDRLRMIMAYHEIDQHVRKRLDRKLEKNLPNGQSAILLIHDPQASHHRLICCTAAELADSSVRRGDYRDNPLHDTVSVLLWIYSHFGGRLPAFSKRHVGVTVATGTASMIGKSPVSHFVYDFFEIVDPELSQTSISSAIEAALAKARKRKKQGADDWYDIANLSDP